MIAGTQLPVAANLHFLFTEVPFLERFAAAARAGFRAVEFPDAYDHPPAQLAGLLATHGLTCALVNFPMGDRQKGELGFACHPDRRDEFAASVPLAIATARALGCHQLNCMAGYAPPGADPAELRATLVENLRLATGAAGAAGLKLLLEPLNIHDRPGLFVTGSAQAMAIIDEVGADNLQLQFDCYHLHRMGESFCPHLRRCCRGWATSRWPTCPAGTSRDRARSRIGRSSRCSSSAAIGASSGPNTIRRDAPRIPSDGCAPDGRPFQAAR